MNYWFHRISHWAQVAYPLLDKGYLTIGFLDAMYTDKDLALKIREEKLSEDQFRESIKEAYGHEWRGEWNLWRFAKFAGGDYIVVPSWKTFAVFKVIKPAAPIDSLPQDILDGFTDWNKNEVRLYDEALKIYDGDKNPVADLGFFVKVEPATNYGSEATPFAPREIFLRNDLNKRLKSRFTTGQLNDLKIDVDDAIDRVNNNKVLNFYKTTMQTLKESLLKLVQDELNENKMERLVAWYMKKIGANRVDMPAKNSPDKPDAGDADVIAYFDTVQLVIYVQVKHYTNKQYSNWAVEQIKTYAADKGGGDDGYAYAGWVLSSCDEYDDNVINAAKAIEGNSGLTIRLIDGPTFAEMLLNAGFTSMDEAGIDLKSNN